MDQYFDRMKVLAENQEFPKRIRFMLQGVIELRKNNWIPRKAMEGPMPINQVWKVILGGRGFVTIFVSDSFRTDHICLNRNFQGI